MGIVIYLTCSAIVFFLVASSMRSSDTLYDINHALMIFWDDRWWDYASRVGGNPDPRLLAKRIQKMLTYKDNRLNERQKWSYFWRKTFRVLDPYVSLNDTQKWMLGVKTPYRPKTFSKVLIHRKPEKAAMAKAYHNWMITNGVFTEMPTRSALKVGLYDNWYRHTKWKSGSTVL